MVNKVKNARYQRLGSRYGVKLVIVILLILLAAVLAGWFWFGRQVSVSRTTVVINADPVWVWSWDSRSNRTVILKIPAAAQTEGVHGYGKYSLEALWKLGQLDKSGGLLLSQSLEEALGVSIPWYIGEKTPRFTSGSSGSDVIHKFFSPAGLGEYLRGSYRTNLPLPVFISLSYAASRKIRSDRSNILVFSPANALTSEVLPDSTSINVVDPQRVDFILGNLFEDEIVRQEGLSVAVYNTTRTPSLGGRLARLLGRMGAVVVTVGNAQPTVEGCQLIGHKAQLKLVTSSLIRQVLGCQSIETTENERADLIIRVGTAYEARFAPIPR